MYKKLNEIHKNLIPMKLITRLYSTIQYNKTQTVSYNTNIPYNWPAFIAVNSGYITSYALIRISY